MTKKVVLLVDDSSTVRQQLRAVFGHEGYEVVEAIDGQEGFDKIQARPDLALVICDLNMPRMSGFEMLEALQQRGRPGAPPIMMLTTEHHPTLVDRARKAGARGWIVKPFNAGQLVAAARKLTPA